MQKARISERSIRRGKISWEQSQVDLKLAKSFVTSSPQKSCLLSVQASINAISSILEVQGHFQLPAFSCVELLDKTISHLKELEGIRSQCYFLDSMLERELIVYEKQKNISFTVAYARACYRAGQNVLRTVRIYWKENTSRLLDP